MEHTDQDDEGQHVKYNAELRWFTICNVLACSSSLAFLMAILAYFTSNNGGPSSVGLAVTGSVTAMILTCTVCIKYDKWKEKQAKAKTQDPTATRSTVPSSHPPPSAPPVPTRNREPSAPVVVHAVDLRLDNDVVSSHLVMPSSSPRNYTRQASAPPPPYESIIMKAEIEDDLPLYSHCV